MPRAGGIFSLIPGYFAVDGTTIKVSQHNPVFEDVAQALTDSLPRDGSAPMTGNLAMGSNKITGLAAATNPADAVRFDQLPTFTTATLTAGTNAQGQGPITTDQVTITVAAANPSGATLPTAVAGKRVIIANRGANPVNIYPATGAAIGALAANAPVLLAVNQSVEFFARSATQWEGQISQPLDSSLTEIAALPLVRGDLLRVGVGGAVERLPKGTAGQFVGYDANDVLPVAAPSPWTYLTLTSHASGGPYDFTIPAGVTTIEVYGDLVSLTGTGNFLVQIGTGGVAANTGYNSVTGNRIGETNATNGFVMQASVAASLFIAKMTLTLFDASTNTWISDHTITASTAAGPNWGAGRVALAGTLDTLRWNYTAGSPDAGNIRVRYQ